MSSNKKQRKNQLVFRVIVVDGKEKSSWDALHIVQYILAGVIVRNRDSENNFMPNEGA